MMTMLRKRLKSNRDNRQARINELNMQLKQLEERQHRLLEAIETGTIEMDELTQKRAQINKASREAILVQLGNLRREHELPIDQIKASQINSFAKALRQRLMSKDSALAKSYLNLLVDEIVVNGKDATMKGSYAALVSAAEMDKIKVGYPKQVPTFMSDWRARRDSNS